MRERHRFYDRELSDESIDRIVVATGLACASADREEMSIDLPSARAICVNLKREVSRSVRHRKTAKLNKVIKLVRELTQCLSDTEINSDIFWRIDIRKGNPREALEHLASAAHALLPNNQPPIIESRSVTFAANRSEFENLAGLALPNVFKLRFHRIPRISRNSKTQEPDGPFIRFAHQALVELDFTKNGKPYSREAIARAFTLVRSGRTRRNS